MLSRLATQAPSSAEAQTPSAMQTIGSAVESLAQGIQSLLGGLEKIMDRLTAQLNLDTPEACTLSQANVSARLKVSGSFGGKEQLEEALNRDCFAQQSFQALHIRYAEMRGFEGAEEGSSGSAGPAATDRPVSVDFKKGKAALDAGDWAENLWDKLMEELDRNKRKEEKYGFDAAAQTWA